jgi:nucleoid-associated protein YgaU
MAKRKRGRPRKTKVVANRKKPVRPTSLGGKKAQGKKELSYFQLRDSYTSLLLGIGVVVFAAFLLVGFFKSNNKMKPQITEVAVETTQSPEPSISPLASITSMPSPTVTNQPTSTTTPTKIPSPTLTKSPTPTVSPTLTPTKMPSRLATPSPEKISGNVKKLPTTYTVAAGDTLWLISERFYSSGYNWVDIARENKLADAGHIEVGQKLTIPSVPVKMVSSTSTGPFIFKSRSITSDTYVIQKGDTLWSISVRAYGDGYKWPDLAKANGLEHNPGLIHADNTLKIPR